MHEYLDFLQLCVIFCNNESRIQSRLLHTVVRIASQAKLVGFSRIRIRNTAPE